jgi:uncharacterized protein YggT (Ycf19 family)
MADLLYRAVILLWFVAYMSVIYLGLHLIVMRFARSPESRLLWFFSIVTGPLTRPVRAILPPGTSPTRIRLVALLAYGILWLALRTMLGELGAARPG